MVRRHRQRLAGLVVGALLVNLLAVPVSTHETQVHRALTENAVDYLLRFRPELNTTACSATLKARLGEGAVREDDPVSPLLPYIGSFFFHFSPALFDTFPTAAGPTDARGTCNSLEWGHAGAGCRAIVKSLIPGVSRDISWDENRFHYDQILADLRFPPDSAEHNRGLEGLGHYLHLLQDLTSPAHVRNDAHPHMPAPGIDELGNPSVFEVVGLDLVNAGHPIPAVPPADDYLLGWTNPGEAFTQLRAKTEAGFWSEKNIFQGPGPTGVETPTGYFRQPRNGRDVPIAFRVPRTTAVKIDRVVATEQFDELAPVAVRYTASMINHVMTQPGVKLCPVQEDVTPFSVSSTGVAYGYTSIPSGPRQCFYHAVRGEGTPVQISLAGTVVTRIGVNGHIEVLPPSTFSFGGVMPLTATLEPDAQWCNVPIVPATLQTMGIPSVSGPLQESLPWTTVDKGRLMGRVVVWQFCDDPACTINSRYRLGPYMEVIGYLRTEEVRVDDNFPTGISIGDQQVSFSWIVRIAP